jgi:hypothetical protein
MDDMNAHGKEFSLIFNEDKKKKLRSRKKVAHLSYARVMKLLMISKLVFLIS